MEMFICGFAFRRGGIDGSTIRRDISADPPPGAAVSANSLSGAAVSTDLPPGAMTAEAATGIHNEKTATESDISVTVFSQLCCCAQF